LLDSSIDLVVRKNPERVTAQLIAASAGVSRGEFECHFSNGDECLQTAFEDICDRFDCHLLPIYLDDRSWRERMRAATYAAARYCLQHEDEVLFVLATRAQYGGLERAERSLHLHLAQVDSLRLDLEEGSALPLSAAELTVGSFLELVAGLGAQKRLRDLPRQVPGLLYNLFRMYLGAVAAEEELALATAVASR
jgi:AcrR family transcriptional regulator